MVAGRQVCHLGRNGWLLLPSVRTFFSIFGQTIAQVRMFTSLPILLSELGVGPNAGQAQKIPELFAGMRQYGTLGLVWFTSPSNRGSTTRTGISKTNPAAETAFRHGVSALTLTHP